MANVNRCTVTRYTSEEGTHDVSLTTCDKCLPKDARDILIDTLPDTRPARLDVDSWAFHIECNVCHVKLGWEGMSSVELKAEFDHDPMCGVEGELCSACLAVEECYLCGDRIPDCALASVAYMAHPVCPDCVAEGRNVREDDCFSRPDPK